MVQEKNAHNIVRMVYTNIDQKLVNSFTRIIELWNRWIRLSCYNNRTRVYCIHIYHLFCNALVHVIYSEVSGQYSYTISHDILANFAVYIWLVRRLTLICWRVDNAPVIECLDSRSYTYIIVYNITQILTHVLILLCLIVMDISLKWLQQYLSKHI